MSILPSSVTEIAHELPAVGVSNRHARATIFLHGAHVASWRPVGEAEVLWTSVRSWFAAGKPIRGGVPICFPWFGAHPTDAAQPAHGIARLRPWTLGEAEDLADGRTRVVFRLASDPQTEAVWPHAFELKYTVVVGAELELTLEVKNSGQEAFTFEEALHTYFDVADVRRAKLTGLEGARYLDKVDGGAERTQAGPLLFTAETDRVFAGAEGPCTIEDPVLGRKIVVAKAGSKTTVVWNPWVAKAARMPDYGDEEWPGMVCVEAANAGTERVTLGAGQARELRQVIGVRR